MPIRKANSIYTKKENRIIYLFKNPLTKEFIVGHCLESTIRNTYGRNYNCKLYSTKVFMQTIIDNGNRPCMFELEKSYCTVAEAYRLVVMWTKIFCEAGYSLISTGNIKKQIEELYDDNLVRYNERKSKFSAEITSCEKCLFPVYARKKCKLNKSVGNDIIIGNRKNSSEKKKKVSFRFYLQEDESAQIRAKAKACGLTTSKFIREAALNSCVIKTDYSEILNNIKIVHELTNIVYKLGYTMSKTGEFIPVNFETMMKKMEEINKNFIDISFKISEQDEKIKKEIRQEIRKNKKNLQNH